MNIYHGRVEDLLTLWGSMARQIENIGYYKEQPWYTQAGYRTSTLDTTPEDIEMADAVGRMVKKIAITHPRRSEILEFFYGASPKFYNTTKKDRIWLIGQHTGLSRRDIYREVEAGKTMIEGAILLS